MPSFEEIPGSAMVVVAHPDDAEFMCAGTVARWATGGCRVTYVIVTKGDKGSDDPTVTPAQLAVVREAEQRAAGAILGVAEYVFMGYEDAYLHHTLRLRRELTRLIRAHRPEVVITFDPTMRFFEDRYVNHPDHRATGDATLDAVFPSARDRLTFPELAEQGLEPHKVQQVWLGLTDGANIRVDIGATMETKVRALLAHPSQLGSDIAGFAYEMGRAAAEGEPFEFAEAFRRVILDGPTAT